MSLKKSELKKYVESRIDIDDECDVLKADCDIIEFLLDNCEITVPDENEFFVDVDCGELMHIAIWERVKGYFRDLEQSGLKDGNDIIAYKGTYDFGHTCAEWESVIPLGFPGLKERILKYAELNKTDAKKQRFYSQILRVYDAMLRFLKRAADEALKCGKSRMAQGIYNIAERAPKNLFEAMQVSIAYYKFQQNFDATMVRTLGRLDSLFYAYYINKDEENHDILLKQFLIEIDNLKAPSNIPFAMGGTDIYGNTLINSLSYAILDAYQALNTSNTKIHLLISENTPNDFINKAFEIIRQGKNSIVFISDKKVIESLEKIGGDKQDAVNYHIIGCYESGAFNELPCTCNGRVNIVKALEYALNCGIDMVSGKQIGLKCNSVFNTFEELYTEFKRQLVHLSNCAMKSTDIFERNYKKVHSAPVLSGTYTSALEKGGDLYCDYSAKYNNSSINAVGIATAADSLAAIKKLVFDDETMSLNRLIEVLKSNWSGEEALRLTIKNKYPKFGNGDDSVDWFAKDIAEVLAEAINGKPNEKGGKYRLGIMSIDWRWEMGEKCAATADGRLLGETLSQNASASFGADKYGATEHLMSAAKIDASNTPNGTITDIDLHISNVKGENGITALTATLRTFFELGGFAVHYNVLNTDVLKDAKLNPKKYPNLQVRLCGWNVLFANLSDKEKDEFIARSVK